MIQPELLIADAAAIMILTFLLYVPRHHRPDMVVAILGVNVGVLAICRVLTSVDSSVGLGIGLFGVLSIIRLRSDELDQREVAYYFAALTLGLLGGTRVLTPHTNLALIALVLLALFIGDHPRLLNRYRAQLLTLDRAWLDDDQLHRHLGTLLEGEIKRVSVKRVDLVNDTTLVEVRYRLRGIAA